MHISKKFPDKQLEVSQLDCLTVVIDLYLQLFDKHLPVVLEISKTDKLNGDIARLRARIEQKKTELKERERRIKNSKNLRFSSEFKQ